MISECTEIALYKVHLQRLHTEVNNYNKFLGIYNNNNNINSSYNKLHFRLPIKLYKSSLQTCILTITDGRPWPWLWPGARRHR